MSTPFDTSSEIQASQSFTCQTVMDDAIRTFSVTCLDPSGFEVLMLTTRKHEVLPMETSFFLSDDGLSLLLDALLLTKYGLLLANGGNQPKGHNYD